MQADNIIRIIRLLESKPIDVIVDGEWGVNGLLGRETRDHEDMDIVIDHDDAQKRRSILVSNDFTEIPRDDSYEYNFVMRDDSGRQVDIQTFHFDDSRGLTMGLDFPYDSISGKGLMGVFTVRCFDPAWVVKIFYRVPVGD